MASLNIKTLATKLNSTCRRALEGAAGLCLSRTNYNVEIEHWLIKMLEPANTDLQKLLKHYDVDASRVSRELTKTLDQLRTGNARAPELSLEIIDLMREAWVLTTLEFGGYRIRSGYLLAALLTERTLSIRAQAASRELAKINGEQLKKEVKAIVTGSIEDEAEVGEVPPDAAPAVGPDGQRVSPGSKTPSLDQFTMNLTDRARKGEIDPVIGRDFEIRQVIDILTRRRQNNPLLAGEAGVGKTAVVEGFALRIVAGDVPPVLKGVDVRTLDLGLLQAGAGVKGEFENRLKSVIQEVKSSPKPIILFIDEAHTLIGAGGSAGQGDAANLLKPALARGELRTIAATTWMEYKKYFETDAALKRRFQVVRVEEPDEDKAVRMMRGLCFTLEKHHKVRVMDEAIVDAVKLSHRYITDRQLPDKCVSLLDTSCAKVAIGHNATPAVLEDCRREIDHLAVEIGILEREAATGAAHDARLHELKDKKKAAEERCVQLEKRWKDEIALVAQVQEIRGKLEAHHTGTAPHPPTPLSEAERGAKQATPPLRSGEGGRGETPPLHAREGGRGETPPLRAGEGGRGERLTADQESKLRADLEQKMRELKQLQGETPLVSPVVDAQAVAEVVSGWTGIPIGKMVLDEIKTVLSLKEKLAERIIGQDHALEAVAQRIRTSRAQLGDPRRPIGVFFMVGPSGVGKTETAIALADILYGGDRNMVVINMSEYKESHKISRLTGSAPGYVGYGEGGVLTEAVRRKPYSIILLDEVEKSHPDVQEVFYQVFDKGMLQDDKGEEINFKNTIIILTSNVGTDTIMKVCADPDTRPNEKGLTEALRPDLLKVFKPALLGRMSIVPYFPLTDEVIRKILKLQLRRIEQRVRENHKATFTYDDKQMDTIAGRCKEVETGARNIDHIISGTLLPEMAREFLSRMAEGNPVSRAHVTVDGEGKFVYQIS